MSSKTHRTMRSAAFLILFINCALGMSNVLTGNHVFGNRTDNDRVLYRIENTMTTDGFFFSFSGPETTDGPKISCVEIVVNDIFNKTHAYISSGGIGETSVVAVLAVLQKTKFTYEASVYGL